tara:strand:- start:562 stop:777 length:216 start_codon:yes stop_codon:yes gene_type:complete
MIERTRRWIKYHVRWQSGFLISFPTMWLFNEMWNWPLWASIIGFQFIGALVYYPIDNKIFSTKNKISKFGA